MRWYLHPDGNEFLEWHPGKINKVLAPTTVQRVEPEAAVSLPNGKFLAPLTDAGASPPAGKVVDERSVAFDAEAGTATAEYTYRDATVGEATAALAARKAAMVAAARARYTEIADGGATVTVAPGVTIAVATQALPTIKLMRAVAHMTAAELSSMGVVTSAGAPVDLTPALAALMLSAIDIHVAACEACQNALVTAIAAAADDAALDLIDIDAGTVEDDGGWPANGS